MADSKVTPIRVPADLLDAVDRRVGPRGRTGFFLAAARRELARLAQVEALKDSAGAWRPEDHPGLPDTVDGMAEFVRTLRSEAARQRQ